MSVDSVSGGRQAAEHLVALGHRNIGFINGPMSLRQCVDRRKGFLAGLEAAGLRLRADVDIEAAAMTIAAGGVAAASILCRPETCDRALLRERPTRGGRRGDES